LKLTEATLLSICVEFASHAAPAEGAKWHMRTAKIEDSEGEKLTVDAT